MNAQHWGPAKKRLEYRAEPTSLQLRNRPFNKGRAPHRNPEYCFQKHCSQRLAA